MTAASPTFARGRKCRATIGRDEACPVSGVRDSANRNTPRVPRTLMDIDMKRTWFQVSTWLLWLALPLTALRYWMAWDQLPARMATHFDVSGHPNGWMPRDTSLWFALGLTALMLVIFTLVPYLAARKRGTSAAFCWACVAFAWVIVGFVFYVNNSLVEYNLTGHQIAMAPILLIVPVAIVVLTALFLASGRGPSLTSGT